MKCDLNSYPPQHPELPHKPTHTLKADFLQLPWQHLWFSPTHSCPSTYQSSTSLSFVFYFTESVNKFLCLTASWRSCNHKLFFKVIRKENMRQSASGRIKQASRKKIQSTIFIPKCHLDIIFISYKCLESLLMVSPMHVVLNYPQSVYWAVYFSTWKRSVKN